jgi:hypothetical protein
MALLFAVATPVGCSEMPESKDSTTLSGIVKTGGSTSVELIAAKKLLPIEQETEAYFSPMPLTKRRLPSLCFFRNCLKIFWLTRNGARGFAPKFQPNCKECAI